MVLAGGLSGSMETAIQSELRETRYEGDIMLGRVMQQLSLPQRGKDRFIGHVSDKRICNR